MAGVLPFPEVSSLVMKSSSDKNHTDSNISNLYSAECFLIIDFSYSPIEDLLRRLVTQAGYFDASDVSYRG